MREVSSRFALCLPHSSFVLFGLYLSLSILSLALSPLPFEIVSTPPCLLPLAPSSRPLTRRLNEEPEKQDQAVRSENATHQQQHLAVGDRNHLHVLVRKNAIDPNQEK